MCGLDVQTILYTVHEFLCVSESRLEARSMEELWVLVSVKLRDGLGIGGESKYPQ